MTWMTGSIGPSLTVGLLGRTWISHPSPTTRLTPATHTGSEDSRTAAQPPKAARKGTPHGRHHHHRTCDLHRRSRCRSHPAGELGNPAGGAAIFADPPGSGPGEPGNPPGDWPLRPPP